MQYITYNIIYFTSLFVGRHLLDKHTSERLRDLDFRLRLSQIFVRAFRNMTTNDGDELWLEMSHLLGILPGRSLFVRFKADERSCQSECKLTIASERINKAKQSRRQKRFVYCARIARIPFPLFPHKVRQQSNVVLVFIFASKVDFTL